MVKKTYGDSTPKVLLTYHAAGAPANAFGKLKQIETQDAANAVRRE